MRQRGRRSTADISVVVDITRRPPAKPPAELTDAQATIWRDAAAAMPGDWLGRGAFPVLVEYCRHVARARLLEAQIAKFEPEWLAVDGGLERLDKLMAMAERETRAALSCARALRLTPQATMHPRTAGRRLADLPEGPRPWDP